MARKKTRQKSKSKQIKSDEAQKSAAVEIEEANARKPFWRRVLKFLPLVVLALVFSFIFNHAGVFKEVETSLFDARMKLDLPAGESDVVIVDINDKDFDEIFQGQTRPLNPSALQKLLEAIAEGQPCVIGVDIDTHFQQFKNFNVSEKLADVVWERESKETSEDAPDIVPLDVLGGQDKKLNEKSGLPLLYDESEEIKVAREYSRVMKTTEGEIPTLGWAVFKEAESRNCPNIKFPKLEESDEPLIIGYSRGASGIGRSKFHAADILKLAENPDWQNNKLIKNKIVLVGTSYLGEDVGDTPLGKMNGAAMQANVVETELRGGGIKSPGFLSMILLQLFDGVLLIGLFQLFSWRKAALLSLPFILALSLACSFSTYYSFSYWLFYAPVMIGVVLTELIDKAKDFFKKRYKREITETYRELGGHPDEKANSDEED